MGNPNRHLTKQKPSRRTDDEHRRIHNIIRTPEPTYRTAATHSDLVLCHLHHHPPTVTGVEWCVCQQKYEARIILSHNSTQWLVVWGWVGGEKHQQNTPNAENYSNWIAKHGTTRKERRGFSKPQRRCLSKRWILNFHLLPRYCRIVSVRCNGGFTRQEILRVWFNFFCCCFYLRVFSQRVTGK